MLESLIRKSISNLQLSEAQLTFIVQRKNILEVALALPKRQGIKGWGSIPLKHRIPRGFAWFLQMVTGKRNIDVTWFELVL